MNLNEIFRSEEELSAMIADAQAKEASGEWPRGSAAKAERAAHLSRSLRRDCERHNARMAAYREREADPGPGIYVYRDDGDGPALVASHPRKDVRLGKH